MTLSWLILRLWLTKINSFSRTFQLSPLKVLICSYNISLKALKWRKAAVVIKNTFLSNTDGASIALLKQLLQDCNLHTILDCPGGTFLGAGVNTVVLFFERGRSTKDIWYYQLEPGRNLGKKTLHDKDLEEFISMQVSRRRVIRLG